VDYSPAGELWVQIKLCPRYEISNKGRFRNARTRRILKPQKHPVTHYVYFRGSGYSQYPVHHLMALAFLPTPPSPEHNIANHKNCVRDDNRLENLEWVTASENMRHSHRHRNGHTRDLGPELPFGQENLKSVVRLK
jgi:hypothetical protein